MKLAAVTAVACIAVSAHGSGGGLAVHPAGASVPENLLRIELRFSPPLHGPFDIGRLALLDAEGRPIDNAFLDLTLPSADGRRLTVLMDPGRVKSGVGTNLALGRALRAGQTVRLVVRDTALAQRAVVKAWRVTPFDAQPPRPATWRVDAPRARTRDALVVHLGDAISSAAQDLIAVRDAAGARVEGVTTLADGDTVWRLVPTRAWAAGPHAVVAHPDLEDPAGNRACAPFEAVHESAMRCEASAERPFDIAR